MNEENYAEKLVEEINNQKLAPVIDLFAEVKNKMSKEDLEMLNGKEKRI